VKRTYGASEMGLFEKLPLSRLKHSSMSVRESVGELDGLVDSIREHGLLEPIVVRPVGDAFEVVAGNRRLEACKRLHKKSIACHVVMMDDAASFEESLIENIQRQNMSPMEEAIAFEKYVDGYGFGGISRLAKMIGKSESYVSRRIALLDLPDSVTRSITDGRLSSVIAEELIPLSKADAASLAKLALDTGLSRDEVRSMAHAARASARDGATFRERSKTSDLESLERALRKATTILRVCKMRLDAMTESLDEDDWMLGEALDECRQGVRVMIDRLIKLDVRSKRLASEPALRALRASEQRTQRDQRAYSLRAG
jgi:ParB family chromosome partitioning protein